MEKKSLTIPFGKLLDDTLAESFLSTSARNGDSSNIFLFWDRYKIYPCEMNIDLFGSNFPYEKAIQILKNEFNYETENKKDLFNFSPDENNKMYPNSQRIDMGNGVFIVFSISEKEKDSIDESYELFIHNARFLFMAKHQQFIQSFASKLKWEHVRDAKLKMICKSSYDFYLKEISIQKPKITDINMHYGDSFAQTHEKILKILKEANTTGIVLLHGLPGTGKTHYIRYLIQLISSDKQLIYVPPDMAASISTPEFLPFMLNHKDSILIIEDAENIIKSRESTTSSTQAVANLLNLSDGLLGDSLHQPIIATFNCELKSIDPALLRKGRLIAHHEFGKLSVENAQVLSDHLGFTTKMTDPMVLADIYGQDQ